MWKFFLCFFYDFLTPFIFENHKIPMKTFRRKKIIFLVLCNITSQQKIKFSMWGNTVFYRMEEGGGFTGYMNVCT